MPFRQGEIEEMSETVSPATAKHYGISRTGTVLAWPRSSFSFQRSLRPSCKQKVIIGSRSL